MYFNIKNERVGNLFVKPFRSKRIGSDEYLNHVVSYIHLNPLELFEPGWKQGTVKVTKALERKLREYPYSSLRAYGKGRIAEREVLSGAAVSLIQQVPLRHVLQDAQEYYAELNAYAHPHDVKVSP